MRLDDGKGEPDSSPRRIPADYVAVPIWVLLPLIPIALWLLMWVVSSLADRAARLHSEWEDRGKRLDRVEARLDALERTAPTKGP
jgi:hypothetical protein